MSNKWVFIKLFLKQFLDIGTSTGSLVSEIIGLFRTFQRLSAPSEFKTKFSYQCLNMFRWATDIIKTITSYIQTNPLSSFEFFEIYTYIIPLSILTFINMMASFDEMTIYFLFIGGSIMLGAGFGMIGINKTGVICCIVAGVIVLAIYLAPKVLDDNNNLNWEKLIGDSITKIQSKVGFNIFSLSLLTSCLFFSILIYPIVKNRYKFQLIIITCIVIITFITICVSVVLGRVRYYYIKSICMKFMSFILNCISLLIIPATDQFVIIIQSGYHIEWPVYAGYVGINLLLPISITLIMIKYKHPEITKKYKKPKNDSCNFYIYFELIDIIRQVSYAILAAYDILWGCLGIEIVWVILVVAVRPFPDVSNYTLSLGNSIVIIISNGSLLYAHYHKSVTFSFAVTVVFIIIACIPAVASLYLYFIKDFCCEEEKMRIDSDYEDAINGVSFFLMWSSSLSWFFYGTALPIIDGKTAMSKVFM